MCQVLKHRARACRGIRHGAGCRKETRQFSFQCRAHVYPSGIMVGAGGGAGEQRTSSVNSTRPRQHMRISRAQFSERFEHPPLRLTSANKPVRIPRRSLKLVDRLGHQLASAGAQVQGDRGASPPRFVIGTAGSLWLGVEDGHVMVVRGHMDINWVSDRLRAS